MGVEGDFSEGAFVESFDYSLEFLAKTKFVMPVEHTKKVEGGIILVCGYSFREITFKG